MKRFPHNKFLGFLILIFLSLSCSSDLDFSQANSLKIEPVFVSNLAYFEVNSSSLFGKPFIKDTPTVDVFTDAFFTKNLVQAELFFEISNTINTDFTLRIDLLNASNQILDTINFVVPANSSINKTEIYEAARLLLLKNTTKMSFTITPTSGATFSSGTIKLRSGVTAYLIVK